MIGFKFNKAKSMFFDRAKVASAVDSATRKVLGRFGAFVRTAARSSIKKAPYLTRKTRGKERTDFRHKSSRPGRPPYSQTGLLKKFIFFGYDPARQSVVIGPAALNTKNTDAPKTLEHGGTTTLDVGKRKKRITIKARPFMGPAFEKEKPKLPQMWQDSVK